MALSPKLALRQTTALVMTPQLQQAIKLLQLSNQELAEFVESEIEENPLLERETGDGSPDVVEAEPSADDDISGPDKAMEDDPYGDTDVPDSGDMAAMETLPDANETPLDTDFENDLTNDDRTDLEDAPAPQFEDWGTGGSFEGEGYNLEENISGETSLRDHLISQVNVAMTDKQDRLIALALIDSLDEAGYLDTEISDIAKRLGTDVARVETVLATVQGFDPSGVFARDLGECLALQLREKDRLDPAMEALTKNLVHLGRRDMAALRRICGVDDEDLAEMIAEIRALNPKPALSFAEDVSQTVIPDVLVRPITSDGTGLEGNWHIELNPDTLPRVLVNRAYVAEIKKVVRTKKERDYLNDNLQSANWLVKALHQRATTILKVATEIVKTQEAFFQKGIKHLKPLTLREVADAIEMHESTVSRVTTNKFMATPRGVFELKYFFTAAITSTISGESHSAESVRHRIRELIGDEKPRAVLSDDRIVNILSDEGVDIARRTVAKYREAMRIPSSVQRRREKSVTF